MNDINFAMIFISAAGTIILILVSIVGYFTKSLLKAIDQLKETVNELIIIVELQKSESKSFGKLCDMRHHDIEKRFNEIEHLRR
jgi:hypothetical protein